MPPSGAGPGVRLCELAFRGADGRQWRAVLEKPQHAVVAPAGLPAWALRDALSAFFYGLEHFPRAARAGLRQAGLVFEADGARYKGLVDLETGRRVLAELTGGRARTVAEGAGALDRRLADLLGLPEAAVYRALVLAEPDGDADAGDEPSAGRRRQILEHARAPDRLRAEVRAARARHDAARRAAEAADGPALRRDPVFIGGIAGGVAVTLAGFLLEGSGRLVALLGPVAYGIGAFRALRRVDGVEADRRAREAEAALRARERLLQTLEGEVDALAAVHGTRDVEVLEAALARGDATPVPEVQAQVRRFLGDDTLPRAVDGFRRCLSGEGAPVASAALVLAAVAARTSAPPLLWSAAGPLVRDGVDWAGVHAGLGPSRPLLVFWDGDAPPEAAPVTLEPVAGAGRGP